MSLSQQLHLANGSIISVPQSKLLLDMLRTQRHPPPIDITNSTITPALFANALTIQLGFIEVVHHHRSNAAVDVHPKSTVLFLYLTNDVVRVLTPELVV